MILKKKFITYELKEPNPIKEVWKNYLTEKDYKTIKQFYIPEGLKGHNKYEKDDLKVWVVNYKL